MNDVVVRCQRCSMPCRAGKSEVPSARPFKKAMKGLCAECVVTSFFRHDDVNEGVGFALPPDFDPEGLRLPHIQAQFARVLSVGNSELGFDRIDWDRVIANWAMPLPTGKRQKAGAAE